MALALSGTSTVTQAGTGALSMAMGLSGLGAYAGSGSVSASMSLSGSSTVSQAGTGSTSMSMALSGTGTFPSGGWALVKAGTASYGNANTVTPAFGQTTGTGNTLIAVIAELDGTNQTSFPTTCSNANWHLIINGGSASDKQWPSIWVLLSSLGGDTAPTWTGATGSDMAGYLMEWSGGVTSSTAALIDSTGAIGITHTQNMSVPNAASDAASADLVITLGIGNQTNVTGITVTLTDSNGGSITETTVIAPNGQDNFASAYGVTTQTGAGKTTAATNWVNSNFECGCICSLKHA